MGQEEIIFVQSCGDGREVRFAISWPMMARLDCSGKLRAVIYGRRVAMNIDYYSRPVVGYCLMLRSTIASANSSGSGSIQRMSRGISSWSRVMPGRSVAAERPIRVGTFGAQ